VLDLRDQGGLDAEVVLLREADGRTVEDVLELLARLERLDHALGGEVLAGELGEVREDHRPVVAGDRLQVGIGAELLAVGLDVALHFTRRGVGIEDLRLPDAVHAFGDLLAELVQVGHVARRRHDEVRLPAELVGDGQDADRLAHDGAERHHVAAVGLHAGDLRVEVGRAALERDLGAFGDAHVLELVLVRVGEVLAHLVVLVDDAGMDSAMRVRLLRRHSRRVSKPGIRFADSVARLYDSLCGLPFAQRIVCTCGNPTMQQEATGSATPAVARRAGRHMKVSRTRKTSMRESPDSPGPPIHAARSAEDRQFVTALARGLEVLRCFSAETPELGSREIARRIGLSQSTVWRLCHTLSQLGYLVPGTAPGKLRVGAPTLALGAASLDALRYTEIIEPHLRAFVSRYPAAAVLAQQHEMTMIYLIRCNGETSFVMNHPVGTSVPLA